jgi:hypothetical protein
MEHFVLRSSHPESEKPAQCRNSEFEKIGDSSAENYKKHLIVSPMCPHETGAPADRLTMQAIDESVLPRSVRQVDLYICY